jgi:hypothetical protein
VRAADPKRWYGLITVLAAIQGAERPERRWILDLGEGAALLQANMTQLQESFGNADEAVERRLKEFEKADRASMREWEFEVNSRIR